MLGREVDVRERPETGRHAVDDEPLLQGSDDYLTGGVDSFQHGLTECGRSAPRDLDDVGYLERPPELD